MSDLPQLPPDDSEMETRRASPTEADSLPPVRRVTPGSTPASGDSAWRPPAALPETPPPVSAGTQRLQPIVPPPGEGHIYQPSRRKRSARERRDSGLYLPLWSLALMLLIVLGISFSIVALVVVLGGRSAPASDEPIFVIVTAQPTNPPFSGAPAGTLASDNPAILATPTLPPEFDQGIQGTQPALQLQGPTLPAVIFTPTPISINVGVTVRVNALESGLNIRQEPGINATRLFVAAHESVWIVVAGPQQADSLTWWQLQDPGNPTRTGWGAGTYLEVIASP
ncbi:MAG: hypothetical protein HXY40_01590 [Chloroflexi bacterium]|nr:hypothetical protein [Chloroflexota bacterium]